MTHTKSRQKINNDNKKIKVIVSFFKEIYT